MQIMESPHVPEFIEAHRQERKWAHRVMWQRYRRFNVTMVRGMLKGPNGVYFMHPNNMKLLKDSIK